MIQQGARVIRAAMSIEIGWRCGSRHALDARPDGHRDHVLLEPFVVADARVAPRGEPVDEAVFRNDLQPDPGMCGKESRQERGQHQPRGALATQVRFACRQA